MFENYFFKDVIKKMRTTTRHSANNLPTGTRAFARRQIICAMSCGGVGVNKT